MRRLCSWVGKGVVVRSWVRGPLQLSARGRVESVTKEGINKEKFYHNFVYLFLSYYMFDINCNYIVYLLLALVWMIYIAKYNLMHTSRISWSTNSGMLVKGWVITMFGPQVGLREGSILGCELRPSAHSDRRIGSNCRPLELIRHLQGAETWF